ncbi:hypothetical protein ABDK00_016960 [Niabella insulamsoli]|uniref:hypothetical protein n=1 Tax=Niabella insulamsoli TaxID=3144874 RepID=UPI0031FC2612
MAYTRQNYIKKLRYIVGVYNEHKHHDVPDTHIVRHIFPKHNIFLSYRAWMNIKSTPLTAARPANENQLALFAPGPSAPAVCYR